MAHVERCGRVWRAHWSSGDAGRYASRSGFATKRAAQHYADEREASARLWPGVRVEPGLTVGEWWLRWFPAHKPGTYIPSSSPLRPLLRSQGDSRRRGGDHAHQLGRVVQLPARGHRAVGWSSLAALGGQSREFDSGADAQLGEGVTQVGVDRLG